MPLKRGGCADPRSSRSPASEGTSAGKVFGSLGCEMSRQYSGGLTHLDQVAIWVPHVAADLCSAVDRRCEEGSSSIPPLPITGGDVGYAKIQEAGGGVARLVIDDGDVRLIGGRRAARIHDDPGVGELDNAVALLKDDCSAQHLRVERARASDLPDRDEQRHEEAFARRRKVGIVDAPIVLSHAGSFRS